MRVCGRCLCSIYVAFTCGRVCIHLWTGDPFTCGRVRFTCGRVHLWTCIIGIALWKLLYSSIKFLIVESILVSIFVPWHLIRLFKDQPFTDQFIKTIDRSEEHTSE